jgi:succinate dehydrogenase / fumarate reductase, cytochrome b subunit
MHLPPLAHTPQTVKERRIIALQAATRNAESMGQKPDRPLSPHLQIYRWSPQMAISIFHRVTGFVLATAGMLSLLWWLSAIGGSAEAYATFRKYVIWAGDDATGLQTAANWFFRLVALAVTFSFFQHLFSGLRHLVLDMGAGYELKTNRTWALAAFIAAFFATALVALFVASRLLGI